MCTDFIDVDFFLIVEHFFVHLSFTYMIVFSEVSISWKFVRSFGKLYKGKDTGIFYI